MAILGRYILTWGPFSTIVLVSCIILPSMRQKVNAKNIPSERVRSIHSIWKSAPD